MLVLWLLRVSDHPSDPRLCVGISDIFLLTVVLLLLVVVHVVVGVLVGCQGLGRQVLIPYTVENGHFHVTGLFRWLVGLD